MIGDMKCYFSSTILPLGAGATKMGRQGTGAAETQGSSDHINPTMRTDRCQKLVVSHFFSCNKFGSRTVNIPVYYL